MWILSESNRLPPDCKTGALPSELRTQGGAGGFCPLPSAMPSRRAELRSLQPHGGYVRVETLSSPERRGGDLWMRTSSRRSRKRRQGCCPSHATVEVEVVLLLVGAVGCIRLGASTGIENIVNGGARVTAPTSCAIRFHPSVLFRKGVWLCGEHAVPRWQEPSQFSC